MAGQRVGYIRVSALGQHTERQLEGVALDKTFVDYASGKDANRPQLDLLLSFVRAGDMVIVHSMDRLARNLDDLRRIVHTLTPARTCGSSLSRNSSHSPARTRPWPSSCCR